MHARCLSEQPTSIKITMKKLRHLTFYLLIFAASVVSALQVLSLPPDPAPSGSTANFSNPTPPKPSTPPEPPPAVARVPGWTYRGCWSDHPFDRTLISRRYKGYITPEQCARHCRGCKLRIFPFPACLGGRRHFPPPETCLLTPKLIQKGKC